MVEPGLDPAVLLQVDVDVGVNPAANLVGSAVGTFLTTLVVGVILVAVAPEYTEDRMAAVVDDPVGTFVYGIAVFLALLLVVVVLAITIIGIVVVIPLLLLLAYVVWAFGSTVAFLAIADRIVDRDGSWTAALVVAAAINGGLVLTGIGGLVAFVVGAAGFGAVLQYHL